ncbi:hypothetical protein SZN_09501 [Streptomyces zinciresistens K42]|uniref:Uncharacterized protein n=1 Tax=Streptomyces zinciresistens K42 TaxID=700597 RepID=G2G8T2_9ACTN|nr:hypothetical protein [Streptomyces zinciresistens]EGX60147.1 hypothetical protein SZN_09501 [Streptomyces zinciresistens K42]
MSSPASAAEWLACAGIGIGTGLPLLGLMKLALDTEPTRSRRAPRRLPPLSPPAALPAYAPQSLRWHAAPPTAIETQPLRVQHHSPRHAKKAA